MVSQGFDEEGKWGGFGNILNFDQEAKKLTWCSSRSHSTSHRVVDQRQSVHALS